MSIDIFILLLWTFVDRPRGITYESTAGGLYAPVQLTMCSTNLSSPFEQTMVAWKAMLLAAGVYKSICTWDMPSDIAEVSTHSTYSMVHLITMELTALLCSYALLTYLKVGKMTWDGRLSSMSTLESHPALPPLLTVINSPSLTLLIVHCPSLSLPLFHCLYFTAFFSPSG